MQCTDVFRGTFSRRGRGDSDEGITWEDLSMEEFILGEENFYGGVHYFRALFKITMRKYVHFLPQKIHLSPLKMSVYFPITNTIFEQYIRDLSTYVVGGLSIPKGIATALFNLLDTMDI